jgi:hypothetical protein
VLDIQLAGLKCNVDVVCVPICDYVFGCSYVAELAGFYCLILLPFIKLPYKATSNLHITIDGFMSI